MGPFGQSVEMPEKVRPTFQIWANLATRASGGTSTKRSTNFPKTFPKQRGPAARGRWPWCFGINLESWSNFCGISIGMANSKI